MPDIEVRGNGNAVGTSAADASASPRAPTRRPVTLESSAVPKERTHADEQRSFAPFPRARRRARDKFSELASVVRRLSAPGNAAADLPETSDRYELEVDGISATPRKLPIASAPPPGKRVEAVSLDAALAQARADFDARLTARTREFESQKRRAEAERDAAAEESETARRRARLAETRARGEADRALRAAEEACSISDSKLEDLESTRTIARDEEKTRARGWRKRRSASSSGARRRWRRARRKRGRARGDAEKRGDGLRRVGESRGGRDVGEG